MLISRWKQMQSWTKVLTDMQVEMPRDLHRTYIEQKQHQIRGDGVCFGLSQGEENFIIGYGINSPSACISFSADLPASLSSPDQQTSQCEHSRHEGDVQGNRALILMYSKHYIRVEYIISQFISYCIKEKKMTNNEKNISISVFIPPSVAHADLLF